jgi:hypothetical protein
MNENGEWEESAELIALSEDMQREFERAQQFYLDNESLIRQVQDAQRLFREHESLIGQIQRLQSVLQAHAEARQQIEQIVQAAQRFAHDIRWAGTGVGLPFPLRVALTVDAGINELVPAARDVVVTSVPGMVKVEAPPGEVPVTGGFALPPTGFAGQGTVEKRTADLAALSDGQIVFLILVWLLAVVLPLLATVLPPEAHEVLTDSYATFALALTVTGLITGKSE